MIFIEATELQFDLLMSSGVFHLANACILTARSPAQDSETGHNERGADFSKRAVW